MKLGRLLVISCAAATLSLALTACSSSSKSSDSGTPTTTASVDATTRPKVTITATEYSFDAPASLPAGWVDVTLDNKGKAPEGHQVNFVNLGDMTLPQFKAALLKGDFTTLSQLEWAGGPNLVDSGKSATATIHLDEGNYAIVCVIPASDGKNHAQYGMVKQVAVAKTADSTETAPTAANTIALTDFDFTPPATFDGSAPVAVTSKGSQVHEMIVVKLDDGATAQQALTWFVKPAGPPPFASAPSLTGLSFNQTAYVGQYSPGKYAFICLFPDPLKGGLPHALADKMVKEVTVS